jgi:hypothetical protein
MTTFGEVSWTDDVFGGDGKKNTNSKDLFLRLDEGPNEMRLITQPFQYLVHKYKKDDDTGFGQKVQCSAIHGSCPLCAMGDKAKPRWLLGVISRKTNTYKILDISFAVFSQIRKYAKNVQRFGDPTKYDINVEVDKNGGATGYYSVQALNKEPLSAADQVIKDSADLDDLKRRVTPPTADLVQRRIDKINGVDGTGAVVAATPVAAATAKKAAPAKPATPKAATPAVSMTDDEEIEKSFPSYEGDPTAQQS